MQNFSQKSALSPSASALLHPRMQVLVSVRDAAEAQTAAASGVDWIDVKEPNHGSLGSPEVRVGLEIASFLDQCGYGCGVGVSHPNQPSGAPARFRSVALGELVDVDFAVETQVHRAIDQLASGFGIVKIGLAGLASDPDWREKVQAFQASLAADVSLILAAYADHESANAPTPEEVADLAAAMDLTYLLVDTFTKDGRSSIDHLQVGRLSDLSARCKRSGLAFSLAGSVTVAQLEQVRLIRPDVIAVRGAVCANDRTSRLDPVKLSEFLRITSEL